MANRLVVVVVALLIVAPLSAQLAERIQVTLVEVPVNVVDRSGSPVRNLTINNFELFEDGVRRPITHFDAVDLSASAKKHDVAATAAASRNFLILFDLSNSEPAMLTRAKEAARRFVANPAIEGDRIGVGTFGAQSGFRLVTSFTTDRKLVSDAITTLGVPKFFHPADPLLMSSIEMHQAADLAELGENIKDQTYAEILRMEARTLDRASNDSQRQFIKRILDGYAEMALILDRVPGRKEVILLSEGFDAKMIHGRESLHTAEAIDESHIIERGELWRVDNDNRFGDESTTRQLNAMSEICRRSDVVLHAIDIRGIRIVSGDVRDTTAKSNEALFLLTRGTGGMVFKNANSVDEDFRRLLRAEEVVYILGFEAPSQRAGVFHELKVNLVNVSAARAHHRAGYTETLPANTPIERTLTAAEIIVNQIPASDLGVRAVATPFPRADGPAQVPVIVEIDGRSLMRAARGNQIQAEVFIYAFDEKNNIRDFVYQPLGLDVVKLRDRLQKNGVRLYQTLLLNAGRYSIRTLVRTPAQMMYGFKSTTIDVPSFGQAAVLGGSMFDDNPGDWVPVKPPDRAGVPADYPFAIDGAMLVPAVSPVLRSGVASRIGLFVDQLKAQDVVGSINGQDAPLKVAARNAYADGTTKLLLDFTPPPLAPGDYVLMLRVPDAATRNVAEIRFAIR